MVKSLTFLAFAAVATAAPQLGLLSGLNGLKPGSKSNSAAKASASGEPMPDTLSYNQPLKDDDDDDWKKWVDEDPKDPSETEGSTVGFESDPRTNTTTVLRLTTSTSTRSSTRSTTLRQVKSTTAPAYVSTARDEIPAYSTPVTQNNEIESYQTPSAQKNEVAEPYPSSSTIQRDVQDSYHSTTVQRDVQDSYHSTTVQRDVQDSYHSTTVQRDVQDSYQSTSVQRDVQPTPQPYRRRDVPQGYGQAEFSKTSRAAACAIKSSVAVSPMPAVSSAPPAFRQAVESAQPSHESSPSFAAKESSSPVWSATPYSAPVFKPAVTEKQQSYTTIPAQQQQLTSTITTSLPQTAATTPLADAAVPSDAKILVNTLRPASTNTEDVKLNTAYPTKGSTIALDKVAPTSAPAPAATTPVSMMLQPLYPTTTGVSNGTMGRPAASTGAHTNNTLPEFEGAAASSSSFIAGSVIALAVAALAL